MPRGASDIFAPAPLTAPQAPATPQQVTEADRPQLAASYGRKSNKDDEGLNTQHLAATQRAQKDGFHIPLQSEFRFGDDDTLGITKRRKDLDRLMDVIMGGEAPFTRLYIKDKTRLGRWKDPRYHTYLEVLFEQHGVKLCYVEDDHGPIDYESADPSEFLGHHMKSQLDNVMASQERVRLARRVAGGMRARVRNGYYPGSLAPYGTRRSLVNRHTGHVEVQEIPHRGTIHMTDCHVRLAWATDGSVQVVKRVFALAEAGYSMRRIAGMLNNDGLPSPSALRGLVRSASRSGEGSHGGAAHDGATDGTAPRWLWTADGIYDILRNPIYCGDLIWGRSTRGHLGPPVDVRQADIEKGREALIAIGFMADPPISRQQWLAVQTPLDENSEATRRRRASKPDYLLTGLVRCGHCGTTFTGFTKRASPDGRRYYRHDQRGTAEYRAHAFTCPARMRYVLAEHLENAVRETLGHVLSDDRLAQLTREEIERHSQDQRSEHRRARIRELRAAIVELERSHLNAGHCAVRAKTDEERAMFGQVIDQISGQIRVLRLELDNLEADIVLAERARERPTLAPTEAADLLRALEEASAADRKRLVREVIEQVKLHCGSEADEAEVLVRALK